MDGKQVSWDSHLLSFWRSNQGTLWPTMRSVVCTTELGHTEGTWNGGHNYEVQGGNGRKNPDSAGAQHCSLVEVQWCASSLSFWRISWTNIHAHFYLFLPQCAQLDTDALKACLLLNTSCRFENKPVPTPQRTVAEIGAVASCRIFNLDWRKKKV